MSVIRDYKLLISDEKGLLDFVNSINQSKENWEKPEYAFAAFMNFDFALINADGDLVFLESDVRVFESYEEEKWKQVAPYLSGYVELEDKDKVWRVVFSDGEMDNIMPKLIWPAMETYHIRKNLSENHIWCCDELLLSEDHVEATYVCWFDVDSYFGTNTRDDDSTWINFYTSWYIDGTLKAYYCVDSDEGSEKYEWKLTSFETKMLTEKMESYAQKLYKKSLNELLQESE